MPQGAGPANPARSCRAQAPAALQLAGWCQWCTWLFVCGPHKHDGRRLQCHSALDVALPVMLVMAVLLTASVASAVGAIRLCASAA